MKFRIVKQYNSLSPLNGVIETDVVDFASLEDCAAFVGAVNANKRINYDIIDYQKVLVLVGGAEVLSNPTGGYVGKISS